MHAREHVVPPQDLMQQDPVGEAPQSGAEKDAGGDECASTRRLPRSLASSRRSRCLLARAARALRLSDDAFARRDAAGQRGHAELGVVVSTAVPSAMRKTWSRRTIAGGRCNSAAVGATTAVRTRAFS